MTIAVAVLAVAIAALAVQRDILGPQQLQGHALAFERLGHLEVVGLDQATGRLAGRKQQRLKPGLVDPVGQRPGETQGVRCRDVVVDRALGQAAGPGDLLVAESGRVLEAQDLDDLLHWNPRCRHRILLSEKGAVMPVKVKEFQ
ncbi:MAG: hypothetical protein WBM65_16445 [Sedimenticolaceae bacterium]